MQLQAPVEKQKRIDFAKALKEAGKAAAKAQSDFAKTEKPKGAMQMQNYLSKLGLMKASEEFVRDLEALAKARKDALQAAGLPKVRRSAWDVVRRKKTPEQRAAKLVRLASAWTSKIDANKMDLAQVAAAIDGFQQSMASGVSGVARYTVDVMGDVVGAATSKVAPHREVKLAAQFEEL